MTPYASFLNGDFAPFGATKALRPWNPTGKVPVPGTRAGKGVSPFPPGGGALMETGKVVQERHTAPVGAKPAFLQALGTPCACCRRRPTVGTDHARNGQMLTG